jgi:NDP-sugar pyrophosphorylase family protein
MAQGAGAMRPLLVIPMTGVSSRFTEAGYSLPKFLLEVNGQTVIEHVLDMFPDWEDVIFCCNEIHLDDPALNLEARLLERRPKGRIVRVAHNRQGPGWAVLQAKALIDLDRPVVVNYCDFACYWDSNDIARELYSGKVEGCIPAYTGFHPHMSHSTSYAYLKLEGGRVVDIQEKQPWTDTPHEEFASSGTYGFASGKILIESLEQQVRQNIDLNGEFYLSLTFKPLLAGGGRVSVLNVQHFMQWGTPQDFEEYRDISRALSGWTDVRAGQNELQLSAAKVVLASGAGTRFVKEGYDLPKPALPLSGKSLLEHSLVAIPGTETIIVSRADMDDRGIVTRLALELDAKVVMLENLSRGQAESALAGIRAMTSNSPVTVTACDAISIVDSSDVQKAFDELGSEGLIVWTSNPYHAARRNPEQYGWVEYDAAGWAKETWIKKKPTSEKAGVIIGTFGFGSRDFAIESIENLIADGETINREFYLDSLVQRQISAGKPCRVFEVKSFVSVGTPAEYKSVLYWQSCFDKWALHPYKLINDPMVDQGDVMRLSHSFRDFETFPVRPPA